MKTTKKSNKLLAFNNTLKSTYMFSSVPALTIHAIKLALKELAAFHASSFHFINTYPGGKKALEIEYPDVFSEDFFAGNDFSKEMLTKFFEMSSSMFGSCVLVAKKYSTPELATKMAAYQKTIPTVLAKLFESKFKMSYVTHGDAWYNNYLYR